MRFLPWRVMSSPSNTMRPAVGSTMRRIASPVVDLPQPLSPTSPSVSPLPQREAHAVHRLDGRGLAPQQALGEGEMHREILDAQDFGAGLTH